jgi:poly-beta-1,6-N-acetyl-D-glucosamine synthase
MFITTSIYFLMLFLIFWCYCGYLSLLLILSKLNRKIEKVDHNQLPLPSMLIFIACFNEEDFIVEKMKNLQELEYDKEKIEVYFLDGLSTDQTRAKIEEVAKNIPNWHLVETSCKGKINQLNYGLSHYKERADIIVSTDVDTILSKDILILFAKEFQANSRTALVGANISPDSCIALDEDHWQAQNIIRIIESKVFTSSIVVAPCYAFKSSLLEQFPADCVADDVYIAFKANTGNFITKYVSEGVGKELRSPQSIGDFFAHKFRKGNAYLLELFRFFYCLPQMTGWWKLIYLTKFFQLAIMPWVLPYFLLTTVSIVLSGPNIAQIAYFSIFILFAAFFFTSFLLNRERKKIVCDKESLWITRLEFFAISNLVLILVGLSFPFYSATSSYEKVPKK